jgi:hypothetical protein
MLKPYQKQTYCIAAYNGKSGLHPLAPALRESWSLVPWIQPDEKPSTKETSKKSSKKTVPPATSGVQSISVVPKGA